VELWSNGVSEFNGRWAFSDWSQAAKHRFLERITMTDDDKGIAALEVIGGMDSK
jgi:hypothetical protein